MQITPRELFSISVISFNLTTEMSQAAEAEATAESHSEYDPDTYVAEACTEEPAKPANVNVSHAPLRLNAAHILIDVWRTAEGETHIMNVGMACGVVPAEFETDADLVYNETFPAAIDAALPMCGGKLYLEPRVWWEYMTAADRAYAAANASTVHTCCEFVDLSAEEESKWVREEVERRGGAGGADAASGLWRSRQAGAKGRKHGRGSQS
jgi:hypothetical protein